MDPVTSYAGGVIKGKIPCSEPVLMSCKRHVNDLKLSKNGSFPFRFDVELAQKPIDFFKLLVQWEGEFSGKSLKLEPWQEFIVGSIFGWVNKDTGLRRFKYAYVEIPRKNGKSTLASGIGIYMLAADGEEGSQVYSLATKRDQAKIVWNCASKIISKSGLGKKIKKYWVGLKYERSNSIFEPLASDDSNLDGLNPHCVICDEVHQWPNRGLWDVIEDAFGSRRQPLMFAITTAGNNRLGICYEQRKHAMNLVQSHESRGYVDDTYFAYVATVDEEDVDRWQDEAVWWKSNPNLGVSKKVSYLRDQINKAELMPSKRIAVMNKQLNIWTDVSSVWLNMKKWDACNMEVSPDKLRGASCFGGLDLSSVNDLTAFVLVFPPNGTYPESSVLPFFYLPEDDLSERQKRDKVPYSEWVDAGFIKLTPGNIIDIDFIFKDVVEISDRYNVREIGFDPWKAQDIATRLSNQGMDVVQMRQGHATLGPPTSELEKRILAGEIRHGGNPVLRWMASNTSVIKDSNDNIRPDKKKAVQRIDGIVATIMALGRVIVSPTETKSVYENRGLHEM